MRLSLLLSLTVALCLVSLLFSGLGLCVLCNWVTVRREVSPEELKQPPIVTEASEWKSSTGLRSPDGWVTVIIDNIPEDVKKLPMVAESTASEWNSDIGLRSDRSSVRYRMGIAPEGLKQPPSVAERTASDLPCTPGRLWDAYLAQRGMTQLLCYAGPILCLCGIAWIALAFWRNEKRHQGQGRGRTASSSKRRHCLETDTSCKCNRLRRLETNIAMLERCLRRAYRLQRKLLRQQRSRKAAREKSKKRRAFSSSPCNCSLSVRPVDWQHERQRCQGVLLSMQGGT